jgi:hypothetical protein
LIDDGDALVMEILRWWEWRSFAAMAPAPPAETAVAATRAAVVRQNGHMVKASYKTEERSFGA